MNTAIIFASKHGTTEKVANTLKVKIDENSVQLFDLKNDPKIDLYQFSQVIIGGSIHAGGIQKSIKEFCNKHTVELLQKRLGLFICCMYEGDAANKQLNASYPELIRSHAVSKKVVGGEFLIEKMNFIEKLIVNKVSGVKQTTSSLNDFIISELAEDFKNN